MPSYSFRLERAPTPIGVMLIVTDTEERLRAVDWQDYEERMVRILGRRYGKGAVTLDPLTKPSAARRALSAYFDGEIPAIDNLPAEANGTAFQSEVWAALRRIPAGTTTTYGALAAGIGLPRAMRAVGLANGANPIGVVVPCHRVIGADASLTGYGGGLERKRWLLDHERR